MKDRVDGRAVIPGDAEGRLLFSDEPLSFWGGYDAATGRITDARHPLAGRVASGMVLALPATRGSSTTTAILLEAIRRRTAPVALVTLGVDAFLALACTVGEEMYGRRPPLLALDGPAFATLRDWPGARIESSGAANLCQPYATAGSESDVSS